jgi:hypothetical protein
MLIFRCISIMSGIIHMCKRCAAILPALLLLNHPVSAHSLLSVFPKGDKPSGGLFLLLTVAATFLAIAVHELGHLLTGLAQGFRFELFVVGPLGVKRTEKGITVYLNKNLAYMGGIAATTPVLPDDDNRKKFAYVVAAGPLASLLFGLLVALLLQYAQGGALRGFLLVAGACSIGLTLATTLPTKTGVFFTDRARFQRLMSNGKDGVIEAALLSIMAQVNVDQSAKNIKPEHTQLLKTDDEAFMRFWGYYYEYQHHKDNARQAETQIALAELIAIKDTVPAQVWKMLKIEETT